MRIEAYVKSKVVKASEAEGWFHRSVEWRGKRDAPDDLFIKDGRHVWIEFKSPGEVPRPGQLREHEEMRAAGAEVFVVSMIEQGLRALGITE